MISKAQIKYITSLQQKKYRQLHGEFVIEGKKQVKEALQSVYKVTELFCTEDLAVEFNLHSPTIVTQKECHRISALKNPPGVLAVLKIPAATSVSKLEKVTLFLEDISDPGNLGTIIRTCDWFGVNKMLVTPNTVDLFNPKVVQSTMGSIFRVSIHEVSLSTLATLAHAHEAKIIGTDMDGVNYQNNKLEQKAIYMIGNEAKGLSAEAKNLASEFITIPKKGKAESLNAAIAAGILLSRFS